MRNKPQSRRVREIKLQLAAMCDSPEYGKLDAWQKDVVQAYIRGKTHYGFESGQLRTNKSGLLVKNEQDLWKWDMYFYLGEDKAAADFLGIAKYVKLDELVTSEMCEM